MVSRFLFRSKEQSGLENGGNGPRPRNWILMLYVLGSRLVRLFNAWLKLMIRVSPKSLEVRTSEVLFHKENSWTISIHIPINMPAKAFWTHYRSLFTRSEKDLVEFQFGFKKDHFAINAIRQIRALPDSVISQSVTE